MKEVFFVADNIISPLGFNSLENIEAISNGHSGLEILEASSLLPAPICVSLINEKRLEHAFENQHPSQNHTRFEKILILSILDALSRTSVDIRDPKTLLIISTTKGSIDVLEDENFDRERLFLWKSAQVVGQFLGCKNTPLIISNACISGLLAIITGTQILQSGTFENVIVSGADLVTSFVASGFHSFQALSPEKCRPFDKDRKGLNLGEAGASLILTTNPLHITTNDKIRPGLGFSSNDANHISAPSREADGLIQVIRKILHHPKSPLAIDEIGYISAHGTATLYNDEMEALALHRTGLSGIPTNSFKAYWGHTLGAAGILETIGCIYSLKNNTLYPSAGFSEKGTNHAVNIVQHLQKKEIKTCLKLASGFGGCNAAMSLIKD